MKRLLTCIACCCCLTAYSQQITNVEYFFDNDPGVGMAIALSITPGVDITINETLPTASLSPGVHRLIVRAKNNSNKWAIVSHRLFFVNGATPTPSLVDYAEYYFDNDPGKGLATPLAVSAGSDLTLNETINTSSLATGVHKLVVRTRNDQGLYSIASTRLVYINPVTSVSPASTVDYLEYFFDTDPGEGNATSLAVTPGVDVTVIDDLNVSALASGVHTLVFRARNQDGHYSIVSSKVVFVNTTPTIPPLSPVDYVEYFFDTDPGQGNGTSLALTAGTDLTITDELDVSALETGVHKLVVRARNEVGDYSILNTKLLYINPVTSIPSLTPIDYVEYYVDQDPGKGNATSLTVTPATDLTLDNTFDVSSLSPGPHQVVVRARDEAGQWSILAKRLVLVNNPTLTGSDEIVALEYFVDNNPGTGQGKRLSFTGPAADSVVSSPELDVLLLGGATHNFIFRAKNARGFWSYTDTLTVDIIRSLASDSLILKLMYDSTKGPSWTTRTNWLTGNIASWHGVTVVNQEIHAINLPNNNLDGSIPPNFAALIHLQNVNLSGNKITSVPALSHIPGLTTLNVSGNRLDFASLEPNASIANFTYANQAAVGPSSSRTLAPSNTPYVLDIATGGEFNLYRWKRNNETVGGGATGSSSYEIPELTRATMGDYVCEITNAIVPNLVLTTNMQTVLATASITGSVRTAPDEVATDGQLDLLKVTSSGAYDTAQISNINEDGTFSFTNVVLDDYILVASPDTILYPRAIPTYSNSTIFWEEADTILLNGAIAGLNILAQLEPLDVPPGTGSLTGFLEEEDGTGLRTEKTKRVSGSGVTARRAQDVGRGKEIIYELIAYTVTDENGDFNITNLPDGDYRLNMQYPGFPMDSASFLTFSIKATEPLQKDVNVEATVLNNKITVRELIITGLFEAGDYQASVYPNPASESMIITFEKPITNRHVVLVDSNGREIYQQHTPETAASIRVSNLPSGIYLLRIQEGLYTKKVVRIAIE